MDTTKNTANNKIGMGLPVMSHTYNLSHAYMSHTHTVKHPTSVALLRATEWLYRNRLKSKLATFEQDGSVLHAGTN